MTNRYQPHPPHYCKWVTNLSSRQLSPAETSVQKTEFCTNTKNSPYPTDCGCSTRQSSQTDLGKIEDARNSIVGILQRVRPPPSNLTSDECKALSTLHQDDSIVTIPADKGRLTVILDKSDNEKIKALLSYQKTSEPGQFPRLTKNDWKLQLSSHTYIESPNQSEGSWPH